MIAIKPKNKILLKFSLSLPILIAAIQNYNLFSLLNNDRSSLRIFRFIAEAVLMTLCSSICLYIYEETFGSTILKVMLFGDVNDGDDYVFSKNEEQGTLIILGQQEENTESERISYEVANAGMDMLLLLSTFLLFYTMHVINDTISLSSTLHVSFFPLVLFFLFVLLCITPWSKRSTFWKIVWRTIQAPMVSVTFRDGIIGDIFTSTVRPLQDLSYSLFYLCSGLNPVIDETSWLLYTFVLPACTASPLWWRFCQNLRQTYDHKQRWPYLGNAFKYFVAAEVALFGLFVPTNKDSVLWLSCFVGATLYQIWWDTFMDWDLFFKEDNKWKLREERFYSSTKLYYFIFGINVCLRFCWTLSFIPPQTLSRAGLLIPTFSSDADFKNVINPALASAEIIRRSLWALLRVELQAIKKIQKEQTNKQTQNDLDSMIPMNIESGYAKNSSFVDNGLGFPQPFLSFQTSIATNTQVQVLTELLLYATAFASLGIIAAAHKE